MYCYEIYLQVRLMFAFEQFLNGFGKTFNSEGRQGTNFSSTKFFKYFRYFLIFLFLNFLVS